MTHAKTGAKAPLGRKLLRMMNPFKPKVRGHRYEPFLGHLSQLSREMWMQSQDKLAAKDAEIQDT